MNSLAVNRQFVSAVGSNPSRGRNRRRRQVELLAKQYERIGQRSLGWQPDPFGWCKIDPMRTPRLRSLCPNKAAVASDALSGVATSATVVVPLAMPKVAVKPTIVAESRMTDEHTDVRLRKTGVTMS